MKDKILKQYIKENYIKPKKQNGRTLKSFFYKFFNLFKRKRHPDCASAPLKKSSYEYLSPRQCINFEQKLEETFVQYLFKIIDQKGLKDSDVYKKANIDRKLFSKIRSNLDYKPAKNTILALAIALELNQEETKNFLEKAGYALSKSILTDVIVEYYIINNQYDIFTINQTLYDYKLQLLGSNS